MARRNLSPLLALVAGVSAIPGAGCGDLGADDLEPYCESGALSLYEIARVAAGVDFLGIPQQGPPTDPPEVRAGAGEPCSGASNRAACVAKFQWRSNLDPSMYAGSVVATRGDEVLFFDTRAKLGALLAPVDTREEAIFVATGGSPDVECAEMRVGGEDDYFLVSKTTASQCIGGEERTIVVTRVARSGSVDEESRSVEGPPGGCAVEGRLHEGQPLLSLEAHDAASSWARAAYYEAGSVSSFRRLARELQAHRAPRDLVRRARRAAREELRHARSAARLALGAGATQLYVPPLPPRGPRSLERVAMENAVEGCVHEAFAAAVALRQAARAEDPAVRDAMRAIAGDEVAHAQLAWDVAAWLDGELDTATRARVHAARRAALEELTAAVSHRREDRETRRRLGLPDDDDAKVMASALAARLAA